MSVDANQNSFASRRKLMQMELLYDVGLELSSTLDPELLINEIIHRSAMMVDARSVALIKRNANGGFISAAEAATHNVPSALLELNEMDNVWDSGNPQDVNLGVEGWENIHITRLDGLDQAKALLIIADKEYPDGSTGTFDSDDKALIMAFTSQAGAALRNAELHQNLRQTYLEIEKNEFQKRRKLLQMEMLYEIGLELNSSLEPTLILEEILNRSLVMVDARSAALIVRNESNNHFEISSEVSTEVFPSVILEDPILDKVWSTKSAISLKREDTVWKNVLVLPVCSQDYIGGLLIIADKEGLDGSASAFEEEDQSLLQSFAYQAGSALNNAVLYRGLGDSLEALRKSQESREFVQNAFGSYLSPVVVEQIVENPDMIKERGGEERVMTALFSDVAKFSTISEVLTPNELVNFINTYLTEMCGIIEKHGGTIDKFEGDAILAFFGAPIYFEDHASRAVMACIEQQDRMKTLRDEWNMPGALPKKLRDIADRWSADGKTFMHVRMGLSAGPMVVGNMGSKTRADYTMMGDTVNLASRLESLQKYYGTSIAINDSIYNQVRDKVEARKLDDVQVVGKTESVAVYEVLGKCGTLEEDDCKALSLYRDGLDAYSEYHFSIARDIFEEVLRIKPEDGPATLYYERCAEYDANPPKDLIFRMSNK